MIDPTLKRTPVSTKEPGRVIHCLDPEGFETVIKRAPRRGELFADDSGPAAWIFYATADHHLPQRVVAPVNASVYP